MNGTQHQQVRGCHLARDAYLYVRQAALPPTREYAKSIQEQYTLKQQALALGWPAEHVIVIDSDLGRSGSGHSDRPGFEELVRQVKLRRVGIVIALEPSRLTRNCRDWHRLLDACATTDTLLLLDQEGLYEPGEFDDRAILAGNMSKPMAMTLLREKEAAV
jgi:DNA invertase Pin-like site-specific DNA recombinase